VRERGLEPLSALAGWILSPVRLPIPPLSLLPVGIIYSPSIMSMRMMMSHIRIISYIKLFIIPASCNLYSPLMQVKDDFAEYFINDILSVIQDIFREWRKK
jgi:hypothetical protein